MTFFILIVPSSLLLLFMLVRLNKIKKHDLVLYRFCQIRRDAIALVDNRQDELTKKEYASVRSILDCTSVMIHEYEACKSAIFNFRKFLSFLKHYREKAQEADRVKIPNDQQIIDLHHKYRYALAMAFLAYTPYIRSELLIRVLIAIFVLLGKLGVKSLKSGVNYLTWAGEELRKMHDDDRLAHA